MVKAVIRFLTYADFFNIYKVAGTEERGGGQSYIDFPTSAISADDWKDFFDGVDGLETSTQNLSFIQINWNVPIYSDGEDSQIPQKVKIYRRREASFSITAQKITSRNSNRVHAWLPERGFPKPTNPEERQERPESLCIVLYRIGNSIHAGWRLPTEKEGTDLSNIEGLVSYIDEKYNELREENRTDSGFAKYLTIEEDQISHTTTSAGTVHTKNNGSMPVHINRENQPATDNRIEEENKIDDFCLKEDSLDIDDLVEVEDLSATQRDRIVKYKKRNQKIVSKLKKLYNGKCQISGTEHTFIKDNGQYYSEAHHLIPLGKGGSDNVANIVIISPTIHRMLHTLKPVEVDFSLLKNNKLPIKVGNQVLTISYDEKHAELVNKVLNSQEDETNTSQS